MVTAAALILFWTAAAPADLPPEIVRRVEAAAIDLVRGRAGDAHEKLQPLLETAGGPQREELDALLKRYHIDKAIGPLVADLRIDATLSAGNRPSKTPRAMGAAEAGFVVTAVEKRLDGALDPIDKELAIGFRVDAALEALEEQLQHCMSLLDQMDMVDRLQAMQADATRVARAKAKNPPRKDAAANKGRRDQLLTRVVELSLAIIPDQLSVLRDDSAKYADRAKAAARLEDAFAVAKLHFPKYKGVKKSAGKSIGGKTVGQQDAGLKEQEREFDKLAGPLRLKMYHLEQGKLWWLRGRWGVGPFHDGETKAVASRPTLEAFLFYPLIMPDPIPKPLNPLKDARPLPVARRHLEVWKAALPTGLAYDRAERNFRIANQAWKLMVPPPGQPALNYAKIVESDEDFNAFVGYLEYQMALYHWGRLIALASEEELKALEKSIAEDDRFMIPSYLSRQYDKVDPNSTLKLSPPKSDDPRANDVYERRGLSWCIALAQVEVCGVKAVYTGLEFEPQMLADPMIPPGEPNPFVSPTGRINPVPAIPKRRPRWPRPFDRATPIAFTKKALAEVMWDGMRQQYYRVRTEVVIDPSQRPTSLDFLPPIVRLAVALEFVRGYRQHYAGSLTAAQLEELRLWQTDLERRLNVLMGAWANELRTLANQIQFSSPGVTVPTFPIGQNQGPGRNPAGQGNNQNQGKGNTQGQQGKGQGQQGKTDPPPSPPPRGKG